MKKKQLFLFIFISSICIISCNRNNADFKLMQSIASQLNNYLPMRVDEITTLDSCRVIPDRIFRYYYSISQPVDKEKLPDIKKDAKENCLYTVRNSESAEPLKKIEVIFEYYYYDLHGNKLFDISVYPEEYMK